MNARVCLCMPTPWHGRLSFDLEHLPWISAVRQEPFRCAASGSFFSLSVADAKTLIEKMVFNQGWSDDRLQPYKRGMHSVKEIDMLAVKIDLLTKRVEHYEKTSAQETLKAMESHMTCEVYGDVGHLGNSCPKPWRTSTSSTPTTVFVHNNIKARISAPTTKEVTIITLLNV